MSDHDAEVAAVLSGALGTARSEFAYSDFEARPVPEVILAALTAAGIRCLYVPEGVAVAHGARLVRTLHACSACRDLYAIKATP